MILAPAPAPLPSQLTPLAREIQYPAERRSPGVFLDYQGKWVTDKARVKVMEKSRRVGLSWGEAEDAVECAAAANGMDVWYIGYAKDMAIEFILDCAQWAQQLSGFACDIEAGEEIFIDGDERQSVLKFSITFASGHLRVNVMVPLEMRQWPEAKPGSFDLGMHTSSVGAGYFVEHLGETFELRWFHHISSGNLMHDVEFHLSLQQSDPREARVWTPPLELQHEIGEWLHKAGEDVSGIPANIEAALRAAAVAMLDQQVGYDGGRRQAGQA